MPGTGLILMVCGVEGGVEQAGTFFDSIME